MQEIFVSTDIEADGPIPGDYSMLSFGSVALTAKKKIVGSFSANLETLPGAGQDYGTMKWWKSQPQAWEACRKNLEKPEVAMKRYLKWLNSLPGSPVFVGYPAGFDFMFIYWYMMKFTKKCPFSFMALDIKTYAMAILKKQKFKSVTKSTMPVEWFDTRKKSHVAVEDAMDQGLLFCNMLALNLKDKKDDDPKPETK